MEKTERKVEIAAPPNPERQRLKFYQHIAIGGSFGVILCAIGGSPHAVTVLWVFWVAFGILWWGLP